MSEPSDYSYGQIEQALMKLHGLGPGDVGAFRGRWKRLGTLGVPLGPRPGSGAPRGYGDDEIAQMIVAFELAQLDIDPKAIALFIKKFWRARLRQYFRLLEETGPDNPVFIWFCPSYMTDSVRRD